MKNFTKQNFKTNPLWIRLLIMTFMLVLSAGGAMAANTVKSDGSYRLYFKFSGGSTWWNGSGCYHYAWVWANGGNGQIQRIYKVGTTSNASTGNTTDVFYMNIPKDMTLYGMILFRGKNAGPANGSTTYPDGNTYSWHNKTNDIVLPNNISTYNLVTAVTEKSSDVTQTSRYTTVSVATTSLTASNAKSGSGTQADPYVFDENTTMKLSASATIDDHNFQIQLAYGSSTSMKTSGSSQSIDVALTTAATATAYTVTYTPCLGGSTSYKGTASTKTIYYKTEKSCETPSDSQYKIGTTEYTWDGTAKKPTVTENTGAGAPTSIVYKQGETTVASPTNVGTYDVYVTSGDGATYCGASDLNVGSFEIKCKEGNALDLYTLTKASEEYVGAPRGTGATPVTGAGTATIIYKQGDEVVSPINVGIYDVYITSEAGTGYCAITTPTKIGTFEVTCKTATASQYTISATSYTYDGTAKKPTVSKASGATAAGDVTSTVYKQGNTTVTNPINAGTYDIYITTAAGTGYCALTNFKVGSFIIKGKAPVASDFTYTAEKNYTGAVVSADVAWKTGLAAGTGGAITTYYKVKDANDDTYTTTQPSAVGIYTVAVTTAAGGNYAAATTKIALGDFTIVEVCNPITNLTWSVTSGAKATYCAGDKVQVTMTYDGNTATAYGRGGNYDGNIDFNVSSMASGVVYTFTIRKSGTINLTLTGCDGKTATTPTLTFNVMADPATPTVQVVNNIIKCGNDYTQFGQIKINSYNAAYTYQLGDDVVEPNNSGIVDNLTTAGNFTVSAINGCSVKATSAAFSITETNNKPTITGAIYTQPGKANAITLTAANGILADWSVDNGGDLSKTSKSNTTDFSAEANGTYIITADNGGCTDTHVVTVSDAFYIWVRNAKEDETAYGQFYYPNENSPKYRGGEMFYAECDALPTQSNYSNYNRGGREADLVQNDCDGYTWYGFRASADVISGTKYFYVHAKNDISDGGYFTHTVPTKVNLTGDVYYTLGTTGNSYNGWNIVSASAPYSGPVVHATDASFNKNNFADFAALYVTDCSGKELKSYQWQYSATENGEYADYSSVCTYVGKKTEQGDAGKTNNIRPNVAGWYRCTATYNDDSSATSAALEVTATSGTTKADFKSNLPVIMVNTGSKDFPSCPVANETASKHAEEMKEKLSVDVRILSDGKIVYDRKARMAYRGSSSLNFQKKSYAFCPGDANCGDADKGEDYVKTAKLNMLGIGNAYDKDWVLYAAAADPSMLRNRMVFETYQAMRPGEWGVKSRYVELIINGEYKGVYVMMDKITQNKNRVNVEWDVKDASKRGFILKFDKTDIADRSVDYPDGDEKTFLSKYSGKHDIGTYDTTNDQAFEIEYPEKGDIEDDGGNWYEVIDFIKGMVNDFETALATGDYAKVQQIIDYESWADWFILSEYTKNVDAFRASCMFVYDGTKLKATPLWDQELSFNNQSVHSNRYTNDGGNKGCQDATGLLIKHSGVYSDNFAAPFWFTGQLAGGKGTEKLAAKTFTGALLNDQCFVQMVKNRWAAHKEGALSASSLNALITAYENELTSDVRTREASFWSSNGYSRNTLSCPWGGNSTGYYDDSYADAKADITAWISDNNASTSGTGRRKGLEAAISALEGTGLDISISPASIETTPWVPVVIQVQNETGYEYTLTYTDGSLDQVKDLIIERSGDTYKYHIPRPAAWGTGNEAVEGEREGISYGIKATLQIGDANNQCGTSGELPSAAATIILQDEENDDCPQP